MEMYFHKMQTLKRLVPVMPIKAAVCKEGYGNDVRACLCCVILAIVF